MRIGSQERKRMDRVRQAGSPSRAPCNRFRKNQG